MEYEEAKRLCAAVCSCSFWEMGISEAVQPIGKATLAELVEAARIMREHPGEKTPEGTTKHYMHPDDRLIAAVYAAVHYEPSPDQADVAVIVRTPRRSAFRGEAVLALVEVPERGDDEGEEA